MRDDRKWDFADELRGDDDVSYKTWQRARIAVLVIILAFFAVSIFAGCSTSLDTLYAMASDCRGTEQGPECDALWEEIDRREERALAKEREEAPTRACNASGGVMYCEHHAKRYCQCVSRESITGILR